MTPNGYRGVLLGVPPRGWRDQLRMPLLQRALCIHYARPVEEIEVGIQEPDGSGLNVTRFSPKRMREAEREFLALGEEIKRL
jgi:hypothetical protein